MDPALKQRLIGAAVLVALAVIFLPMLLRGPAPDGGASHVPLELPEAPDRRFETRELPLLPPAPTAPDGGATAAVVDEDPDRIVTVEADVAERPDLLEGVEPASADADEAAAAATDEPPPALPEPPVGAGAGGYAVNLGSYTRQENARALVSRLQAAELPAYSEQVEVGGRPALRVRLGPFSQRADAEAARQRALAERDDLPTSVISLDESPAATAPDGAAPSPAPAAETTGFAVQVGAFRTASDADRLVAQLRDAGFTAFSESVQTGSGTLHRVRVGPALDRAAAERLKASLPAPHSQNGLIVSHP